MLAIFHALRNFRHYVTGYQNFVHTDHATIKYLKKKPDFNARIIKCLLLLQYFDVTIVDKPRKESTVTDFLSRLALSVGEERIMDG